MKDKIYYYHFKRLNLWLLFNLVLIIKAIYCIMVHPKIMMYPQSYVILGCIFVSVAAWCYKYLLRHPMALVTDEGIKIDHCEMLKWQYIASTEERVVHCGFQKMKVLVLHPKKDIDYRYNFLQKHNCGFTAFSIPLYGIITPQDEQELVALIHKKVKKQR